MGGHDPTALRDALQGLQEVFARAARQRVDAIRTLARVEVGEDDAPALRALVEALLRREAVDADQTLPLAERVARATAQARAAAAAGERLVGHAEVAALSDAIAGTWHDALDRSDVIAARLPGRVAPEIAEAFAGYVASLRALHEDAPGATAGYAAALDRLNRATGFTG
jgi:hypothetical protein